jgi:IS5 family transposase
LGDSHSGLVRVVCGTAANVADVTQIAALLTGEEKNVHADAGYTGAHKYVKGEQELHVAEKRGKVKAMVEGALKDATVAVERVKAQLRARVEHPQVPHFANPNRSISGQARVSNQRLAGSLPQKNPNPCSVTLSPYRASI